MSSHVCLKQAALWLVLIAVTTLLGCGGKNGLVGGGQGNPIFLTSISMTPVKPTISLSVSPQPASTTQFVVIGTYNVGNPKDITAQMTWISRDSKVATIDGKGIATATGSGQVVIDAQIIEPANQKTFQASTILTVVPQLTGIHVSPGNAQIAKGTSQQFTATGTFNDGTQADITALASWTSSNSVAATVSSSPGTQGRAIAVSPGAAEISASLGSLASAVNLDVTDANLVSLSIQPNNPLVPLRNSKQISAIGKFDDGSMQDISTTVSWNSSDARTARVTSTGTLASLGLGVAQITAKSGALTDSTSTTVDASSVSTLSLLPNAKVANGTRVQMHAAAILQDGAEFDVTHTPGAVWSSSDPTVATIAPDGLVTAVAPGSATISVRLGSNAGTAVLEIADAAIQSLAIAPNQATIAPATTQNVIALATFSDASGTFQEDVSNSAVWASDNTAVASVSFANGLQELATGHSAGVANISAMFADSNGHSANASSALNVSSASLNAIQVIPGNALLTAEGGQQFLATGTFSDGTSQDLTLAATWNTADSTIAEINSFGFAIASGPGQTSLAASFGSQSASGTVVSSPGALSRIDICAATVTDPLNNCPPLDPLSPPPPVSFAKDVPFGLIAIGTYTDGSREDITNSVRWTSSNSSVAAVSNESGIPGVVNGIPKPGFVTGSIASHVTITADANGVTASSDVIVTDAEPAFLTITPIDSSVHLGFTKQLAATLTFSDSTTADVTPYVSWAASDPSKAVVYPGGLAYSSGLGTTSVSASLGTVTGSTTLTVQ